MERIQATNGRFYRTPEGTWVPSVTTILSVWPKGHAFDRWLGESDSYEAAIAKRDAAGDRGTLVHDSIASLLKGHTVELPEDADPKCAKLIQGFINWHTDFLKYGLEVIASEIFLVGDGYAGTCDLICVIGTDVWVIDFKTSSSIHSSHHIQTEAYARAWERGEGKKIDRRGVLHLKTTTKKGWAICESPHSNDEDWAAFQACKTIFHYEKGLEPIPFTSKEVPRTFSLEMTK